MLPMLSEPCGARPRIESAPCPSMPPTLQPLRSAAGPAPGARNLRHRGALPCWAWRPAWTGFAAGRAAMLQVPGRVVVMGMGKSGHVGRKIAATLASTGTPAFFRAPGRGQPRRPGHGHRPATWCWPSPTAAKATSSPPSCRCSSAWACPLIAMTGNLHSTWPPCRPGARLQRGARGLPAEPGAHRQHHRAAGAGRRAGRGLLDARGFAPRTLPARTPAARWAASC
jgi:hypothetical protein